MKFRAISPIILIVLSIVMMTGCTDKESNSMAEQSKSYPQEARLTTAEGRNYEVFSPAGVYIRTEITRPEDILNRSCNNWEFSGDDHSFMVEGIFTDLQEVPDVRIKDPIGNEIAFSDFMAERKIDETGRNYQLVSWEQQGFTTIAIEFLDKEQFRKSWTTRPFYNGKINADPVVIYKTDLAEGEVWKIMISGELKF